MLKQHKMAVDYNQPPWDLSLRFWDFQVEAQYQSHQSSGNLLTMDKSLMFVCIITVIAFFWKVLRDGTDLMPEAYAELFFVIIIRLGLLMLMHWRHKYYMANRMLLVSFSRLHCLVYSARALAFVTPPSTAILSFVGHFLIRSTITLMVSITFAFRLPFKDHFIVHGLGTIIAVFWASDVYCRGPLGSGPMAQGFAHTMDVIGCTIEELIKRALFTGMKQGGVAHSSVGSASGDVADHSCWVVTSFLHIALGFVLPTMISYCTECYSRTRFITNSRAMDRGCTSMFYRTVLVVVWLSTVFLAVAWLGLKEIEKVGRRFGDLFVSVVSNGFRCPVDNIDY